MDKMSSETDKMLHNDGTFSSARSIHFTIGDGQQVIQQGSTYQGSQEVQTLKD